MDYVSMIATSFFCTALTLSAFFLTAREFRRMHYRPARAGKALMVQHERTSERAR
jgi:hypothetical protein